MPKETLYVALDINRRSEGAFAYSLLTPKEKIDRIVQRIDLICSNLKKDHAEKMWEIGWREYGIAGADFFEKIANLAISLQDKNYMIEQMSNLVKKYPQLRIDAGTVLVERSLYEVESKLIEKIKREQAAAKPLKSSLEYEKEMWLKVLNKQLEYYDAHPDYDGNFEFENHCLDIKAVMWQVGIANDIHSLKELIGRIRIRSNTSYSIYADLNETESKSASDEVAIKIDTYRKSAPFQETLRPFFCYYQLYRPGSYKTHQQIFQVRGQTRRRKICLEGVFPNASIDSVKPDIDVLVSDSTHFRMYNLKTGGRYIIHLDSAFKPRLIMTEKDKSKLVPLQLYEVDLLSQDTVLRGPLEPFYPIELTLLEQLDDAIAEYQEAIKLYQSYPSKHDDAAYLNFTQNVNLAARNSPLCKELYSKLPEFGTSKTVEYGLVHLNSIKTKLECIRHEFIHAKPYFVNPLDLLEDMLDDIDVDSDYVNTFVANLLTDIDIYQENPRRQLLNDLKGAPVLGQEMKSDYKEPNEIETIKRIIAFCLEKINKMLPASLEQPKVVMVSDLKSLEVIQSNLIYAINRLTVLALTQESLEVKLDAVYFNLNTLIEASQHFSGLKRFDLAIQFSQSSIFVLASSLPSTHPNYDKYVDLTLLNLSSHYHSFAKDKLNDGDYECALMYFQKAVTSTLKIYHRYPDRLDLNYLGLALCAHALGKKQFRRGDLKKAIDYFEYCLECMDTVQTNHDKSFRSDYLIRISDLSMAYLESASQSLSDLKLSQVLLTKAQTLFKKPLVLEFESKEPMKLVQPLV